MISDKYARLVLNGLKYDIDKCGLWLAVCKWVRYWQARSLIGCMQMSSYWGSGTAVGKIISPPGDPLSRHRVVSPATSQSPGDSLLCSRLQFILRAPHRVECLITSASFPCSFLFNLLFYLRVVLQPLHSPERRIVQSVSKLTHTPRFEPSAPPSFFACRDPPFHSSSSVLLLAPYNMMSLQLAVAGTFPTRFNRTNYRHLDTHFIWTLEHWFILSCHVRFYIVLVNIFTIQICIVFIMSHVFLGMLIHFCLVTCPKVMITLFCLRLSLFPVLRLW